MNVKRFREFREDLSKVFIIIKQEFRETESFVDERINELKSNYPELSASSDSGKW